MVGSFLEEFGSLFTNKLLWVKGEMGSLAFLRRNLGDSKEFRPTLKEESEKTERG